MLSKNAIVVTTYQVLASDATYHKRKSESAQYVPPLEQIRWWRIIVDEGKQEELFRITACSIINWLNNFDFVVTKATR